MTPEDDMADETEKPDGRPRCPICQEPNQCGVAAGATSCWCFNAQIPPELVDRVPEVLRGVVCVCRDCVAEHVPSASAEGLQA